MTNEARKSWKKTELLPRTRAQIEKLPPAPKGKRVRYRDGDNPLWLEVTASGAKSWITTYRNKHTGQTRKVTHGSFADLKREDARAMAYDIKSRVAKGEDPAEKTSGSVVTLQSALDSYLAESTKLQDRTVENYRYQIETYLKGWLKRPMASIAPAECREKHLALTKKHGPATADGTMRVMRLLYNRETKTHRGMPSNPVGGVEFHEAVRRKTKIKDYAAWRKSIDGINPTRRALYIFTLLTGMRKEAACSVRIEHVDLDKALLFVPKPKGGENRAFWLPLSSHLVELIRNQIKFVRYINEEEEWLFPAGSKSGHVTEIKVNKSAPIRFCANDLRRGFMTAGLNDGVPLALIKLLMNHSLPKSGDVTLGYYVPPESEDDEKNLAPLRAAQEKISAYLMAEMQGDGDDNVVSMRAAR